MTFILFPNYLQTFDLNIKDALCWS